MNSTSSAFRPNPQAILAVVITLAVFSLNCSEKTKSPGKHSDQKTYPETPSVSTESHVGNTGTRSNVISGKTTGDISSDLNFEFEQISNLITEWDDVCEKHSGEELLQRQWDIEKRAIILGPGDAMLRFLEFLQSKDANSIRERAIGEIGNAILSGTDAPEARQWLIGMQNSELRERLCRIAGKHHP